MLELLSFAAVLLTLAVYLLLPIVYGTIAPRWYKTQTGRVLMWLLASLALAVIYIAAGVFFGTHAYRVEFRIVTFVVAITAGVRFLAFMFQTQFQKHREKVNH